MRLVDRPDPVAGPHDIVVRVHATSLNYRDQAVVAGQYFGGAVSRDTIPLSDGAGEVIAVGSEVSRFKPGDRVAATFFQPGAQPAALGSPLDGMLAEQVVLTRGRPGRDSRPSLLRRSRLSAVRGGHGVARAVSRRPSNEGR